MELALAAVKRRSGAEAIRVKSGIRMKYPSEDVRWAVVYSVRS